MENYGIIGWIVIGGLAGAIAKLLMPGRDPGGCIITVLLGIAGALVAGWVGRAIGWYGMATVDVLDNLVLVPNR